MVTNVSCVHASIRESFLPVICIKTDNLNNKTTMVQGRCMQRAHKKEKDIRFQGLVGKCLSSMPSSFWVPVLYLLTRVISSYGKIAGLMVLWKLYVKGEGFLRMSLVRTSLDINNVQKNSSLSSKQWLIRQLRNHVMLALRKEGLPTNNFETSVSLQPYFLKTSIEFFGWIKTSSTWFRLFVE